MAVNVRWLGIHQYYWSCWMLHITTLATDTLRLEQNGFHFADNILTHWSRDKMAVIFQTTFCKCIFVNENVGISIKISLKFVPKCQINNIPALVQIMAWRRLGDKPLSEPMTVSLLMHICISQPLWVNGFPWSKIFIKMWLKFVPNGPIDNKSL